MRFLSYRSGPLRDPITATVAGIGGSTNLISGLMGRSSANNQANVLQRAGVNAGNQVVNTTNEQNDLLLQQLNPVNARIDQATGAAIGRVDNATSEANSLLAPYRTSGEEANETLRRALMEGGDFNRMFGTADFQTDPGYEFRLREQQRIANAQAGARGNFNAGSTVRALMRDGGEFASNEFENAFQRFRTQNSDRFDRLFGVQGRGQTAATTSGNNLINGSEIGANLTVDAANQTGRNTLNTFGETTGRSIDAENARQNYITDGISAAAGLRQQGSQALQQGIVGAGSAVTGGLQLRQVLRNPSSRVNYVTPPGQAGRYLRTPPFTTPGITSIPAGRR